MHPAAVIYLQASERGRAASLAEHFDLPLLDAVILSKAKLKERLRFYQEATRRQEGLIFQFGGQGLELVLFDREQSLVIRCDFTGPGVRYRRQYGGREMIARAVGLKAGLNPPFVLDATAGLGGDAFVLASLGCRVRLVERVPAVRALLADGLSRARDEAEPDLLDVLNRMDLVESDSIDYLKTLEAADAPDVIYLDPMFPERKKSAAVKKEMQVFHRIVGSDEDAGRLLELALAKARQRVVVKRPRVAPALSARGPQHFIEGKRNRFDIYLPEG